MFRLQPGADPGAPQPTTDFVASLLLDGERPFGRRASNRTIKLPVWITAPDRRTLAAGREYLQQVIDQDFFTVTWTRDPSNGNPGGAPLPLVFDCFRAQPTVPIFNTRVERQLIGLQVELTIPALPYGRSDTQTQVSFSAPVPTSPAVAPPPSPVLLDSFSTISSAQFSQSTQCVVGPFTGCWDPDSFGDFGGQETSLQYGSSFSSPLNLTGMTSLQMWLGLGSRYYANLEFHGKTHGVSVAFSLADTSGNSLSFSRNNLLLPCSNSAQAPAFSRITVPIPGDSATFNYGSVASYSLTVINRSDRIRRFSWVTAYVDNLMALPGSQQVNPVVRGAVYTLYGVQGTARAPVSMSFQQAPSAGTVTTVTATGPGTYTVPAGTTYLKAEAWGGGGAGAGMTASGVGAGGGGSEYAAEAVFPASGGQVIPYVVGAGAAAGSSPASGQATVFGPAPGGTLQVTANGGGSVATNGTVAGLGGSGSANSTEYPGGAGRANPAGTFGGGGGSSAGPSAAGNTPVGSGSVLFTTAGTFSGGSGWLCPAGVFTVLAECWGGGGGGGGSTSGGNGQGGGGGEYRSSLVPVTPGTSYTFTVGAGGAGGVSSGNGSAGGQSAFTGDSGHQVVAKAGAGGLDSGNSGPGAAGGSGGTGTTGHNGGQGGSAYPYTGGGGSSAGPAAQGNSGSSPQGAPAPAQGGSGGSGSGANNGAGTAGSAPGGGGGGSYFSSFAGGAGASGQVRLTYPASTGAPTNAGGTAVSGGGAGGNGGATAGSAGSAGSAPGGGGGGADSSGTTLAGGAGGNGQVKVTPFVPAAFKSLIVHRPPLGALKTFQPMVSVGGGSDPPDGTHQYTMPQPTTGVNADFGGTYTVYLVNSSWSGGSGSGTTRNVFVTVTQFEYAGGPGYSVSTLPITVAPNQVTNGLVTAGVLTLPVKAVAPDNVGGYYTVSVTDSNTSDRFLDCIFLDTQGQTVVINEPTTGYLTYFLDAPDPNVSLGRIMGSQGGRPNAISVMDNTPYISGGPLFVEPADADNQLFVYSADASAPNVSLSYFSCWYFDRSQ